MVAVPTAPTDFALVSNTDTTAEFSWVDASNNELGFKIYDSEDTEILDIPTPGEETATVTSLIPGREYSFYLVAYNSAGNSTSTAPVTFKMLDTFVTKYEEIYTREIVEKVENTTQDAAVEVGVVAEPGALADWIKHVEAVIVDFERRIDALENPGPH